MTTNSARANLITPAKRKQALALATRRPAGFASRTMSCRNMPRMHPISWSARPGSGEYRQAPADKYQYTGTYHGIVHIHLDSLDCHMIGGRQRLQRSGDGRHHGRRRLPEREYQRFERCVVHTRHSCSMRHSCRGKAAAQGWLEPGTAIHREDLEALESWRQRERCRQGERHPSLYRTLESGAPRSALGQGKPGLPAITPTLRIFLKERGVSFIGGDGPNDVRAHRSAGICPKSVASVGAGRDGHKHFR